MKTLTVSTLGAVLLVLLAFGVSAMAQPNEPNANQYAYVMVTGSNIPQKVRIHSIGTLTASPLRVYNRREIDQTGRVTTEDVLAQDPSLMVTRGMPGGSR